MEERVYQPWGMELKSFCTLMHFSQLLSFLIPGLGIIFPIVMWAMHKEQSPEIDNHGKVIFNWMLSFLIYVIVCFILSVIVIGMFGLIALVILDIIFVIIAGIKANDDILWKYPLSINFFKVNNAL